MTEPHANGDARGDGQGTWAGGGSLCCECGVVIRGADEEALLAAAQRHVALHHPALAGRLSRSDLLAMVEWR